MSANGPSDRRLADLIAAIAPAPVEQVQRAEGIPALQELLARADSDPAFRTALVEDLEGTLQTASVTSDPLTLQTVRRHLGLK